MTQPTSDPLVDRATPTWFDDAKLGIFVHWTAAAVPAYAPVTHVQFGKTSWEEFFAQNPYVEWYQNSIAIEGSPAAVHHAKHYGDQPFDTFVHEFRDGLAAWQPEPWADLFATAGARYVVLVTKHHDGFMLWPSEHRNPYKRDWQSDRDIVGELATTVRDRDMRFGVYYSGGLDWTFGGTPIHDLPTLLSAIPQTDEYLSYADAHWRELIERYEPCALWNDIGYPAAADLDGLFRWYLERVPDGVVNNRFDMVRQTTGEIFSDFLTPEYATDAPVGRKWEACRGLGTSFGFNREEGDDSYLSSTALIHLLIDVVARGGNLLLNVGPTSSGQIPWAQAQRLLDLGWWLRANGEAIFDTRPWERPADTTPEGLEVRYTSTHDAVYATLLGVPGSRDVELPLALDQGVQVELLGRPGGLPHEATGGGVRITLPEQPDRRPALALRMTPRSAVRPAR